MKVIRENLGWIPAFAGMTEQSLDKKPREWPTCNNKEVLMAENSAESDCKGFRRRIVREHMAIAEHAANGESYTFSSQLTQHLNSCSTCKGFSEEVLNLSAEALFYLVLITELDPDSR